MTRLFHRFATILSILILSIIVLSSISNLAYASPAPIYQSSPTANESSATGTPGVTTPANAYDNNNATSAVVAYGTSTTQGWWQLKTYNTLSPPANYKILQVDFKFRYTAFDNLKATYGIGYFVGPSTTETVLVANASVGGTAGAPGHTIPAAGADVWAAQAEPNDGVWDWADIGNVKFRIWTLKSAGGGSGTLTAYEAWLTITYYRVSTMSVEPATKSVTHPETFTMDIKITNVDDMYGWEYKLYYLKNLLTPTAVVVGPFLNGSGSTWGWLIEMSDNYNSTHGRVWATQTLLGVVTPATGTGVLSTITFQTDGPGGQTDLVLKDTKIVGYTNTQLYYQVHNTAKATVDVTGAVPEFPLGAALEISLIGVIAYIWWRKKPKISTKPL